MEEKLIRLLSLKYEKDVLGVSYHPNTNLCYFKINLTVQETFYNMDNFCEVYIVTRFSDYTQLSCVIRKENLNKLLNKATF